MTNSNRASLVMFVTILLSACSPHNASVSSQVTKNGDQEKEDQSNPALSARLAKKGPVPLPGTFSGGNVFSANQSFCLYTRLKEGSPVFHSEMQVQASTVSGTCSAPGPAMPVEIIRIEWKKKGGRHESKECTNTEICEWSETVNGYIETPTIECAKATAGNHGSSATSIMIGPENCLL